MKCLIVGGGIAGLCAARDLAQNGWQTILIEPRPRLGGRILTAESQGVAIELGPEFIHGRPKETLDLVDAKEVIELKKAHDVWFDGRRIEVPQLRDEIERFHKEIVDEEPDHSVQKDIERFHADPILKASIHNFVEGFNAADTRQMSAGFLKRENSRGPSDALEVSRLLTGYGRLVNHIEQDLLSLSGEIYLESHVSRINWQKSKVRAEIRCNGLSRSEETQAAIITIPTPHYNLPHNHPLHIEFEPPLEAHQLAAKHLPLGPVVKLVLHFREPLWPRTPEDIRFVYTSSLHFNVNWSWDWTHHFILTCWSGGARAEYFRTLPREEILNEALRELSLISGEPLVHIKDLMDEWYYHDWINDPCTLGAYSYVKVGAKTARDDLARPVEGTVFFAGEATMSDGSAGTVHGAIRSAHRAAAEVLKSFV
jgi:monoamine oxidase